MSFWSDSHQLSWEAEDVVTIYNECETVYEMLLWELTQDLNEYHSISWSTEQYRKLFGNWLVIFVHIAYDRWSGCSSVDTEPDQVTTFLATGILEFLTTYRESIKYNRELCKQLASQKYGSLPLTIDLPNQLDCAVGYDLVGSTIRPICVNGTYHTYGRLGWKFIIPRRSYPKRLLEFSTPIEFCLRTSTPLRVDKAWRLARVRPGPVSFVQACQRLSRVHLPLVFLEGFAPMLQATKSIHVSSLFTSISMDYNLPFKFLAAYSHDATPVFVHQHGGNYGTDRFCQIEDYDRSVSNNFFTWGWVEDETTLPLSVPPRLQSWRVASSGFGSNDNTRILITCANHAPFLIRFACYELGSQNLELIERTGRLISMLQHLDVEISYDRHDYGWNVRKRFSDSDIHISEKSRRKEYYDLHVINYLGAAWLETLAANMPTICFYSRERYLFREGVQPYIDALTDVGILHDSVDSAVAKILEVQQFPQRWWLSDEVQDIRESFVYRYARMEDMWLDSWVEEFSNIASEVGDGGYLR